MKGKIPTIKGLSAGITYHDFSTEEGSDDLGSELDMVITYKSSWKQVFGAKAAFFSGDGANDGKDVSKFGFGLAISSKSGAKV